MQCKARMLMLALAALTLGCGDDDDDDATGPTAALQVDGIQYSASVGESVARNGRIFFVVTVTLRNRTDQLISRRYPVGCAVQVRLYRLIDRSRVYDEGRRGCAPADSLSVSIPAGGSIVLSSGLRYPPTITDTLPAVQYDVRALVRTERSGPVEVLAGDYTLPLYDDR
jgi:hypothetical protein